MEWSDGQRRPWLLSGRARGLTVGLDGLDLLAVPYECGHLVKFRGSLVDAQVVQGQVEFVLDPGEAPIVGPAADADGVAERAIVLSAMAPDGMAGLRAV
ncbi:hypothetical protein GCM10020000_50390 [Streptomyces olivoverticillatus]